MVKNLPAMQGTQVRSLGWEDPLEEGMVTLSSILAWRIPWTEEPGGLQSIGSHEMTKQPQQNSAFNSLYLCVHLIVFASFSVEIYLIVYTESGIAVWGMNRWVWIDHPFQKRWWHFQGKIQNRKWAIYKTWGKVWVNHRGKCSKPGT